MYTGVTRKQVQKVGTPQDRRFIQSWHVASVPDT